MPRKQPPIKQEFHLKGGVTVTVTGPRGSFEFEARHDGVVVRTAGASTAPLHLPVGQTLAAASPQPQTTPGHVSSSAWGPGELQYPDRVEAIPMPDPLAMRRKRLEQAVRKGVTVSAELPNGEVVEETVGG